MVTRRFSINPAVWLNVTERAVKGSGPDFRDVHVTSGSDAARIISGKEWKYRKGDDAILI